MKVLIPAGGKGTRLRPHSLYTPKPLLFVAGDAIIGHILSTLRGLQIEEYRIVTPPASSLSEALPEAYPSLNFSFNIQKEPLGLGHAILAGLEGFEDEGVLILLSDTIIPFDVGRALSELGDNEGFFAAKEVEDPRRFGVMEVTDGYVSRLAEKPEKPRSRLAISGVYFLPSALRLKQVLQRLVDEGIQTKGEYQLTDALSILIDEGEKFKPMTAETWIDCGTTQALLDANRALLKMNSRVVPIKGSLIKPPCWISDGVKIENSVIGPYVSVDKEARITSSVITSSIINRDSVVKNVVLDSSVVGEKAVLERNKLSADLGPFSSL